MACPNKLPNALEYGLSFEIWTYIIKYIYNIRISVLRLQYSMGNGNQSFLYQTLVLYLSLSHLMSL